MKNCKFRRKHCKFRRLLAQVLFLWYHKYNFNEEEVFMKKRVLSLLTAAMMSGTCFFVGVSFFYIAVKSAYWKRRVYGG